MSDKFSSLVISFYNNQNWDIWYLACVHGEKGRRLEVINFMREQLRYLTKDLVHANIAVIQDDSDDYELANTLANTEPAIHLYEEYPSFDSLESIRERVEFYLNLISVVREAIAIRQGVDNAYA